VVKENHSLEYGTLPPGKNLIFQRNLLPPSS
jgi:hypothetical protein